MFLFQGRFTAQVAIAAALAGTLVTTANSFAYTTTFNSGSGSLSNNFNSSSQFDTTGDLVYAVGIGNNTNLLVGPYTFQRDTTNPPQDIDPNIIPGVVSNNAKSYGGHLPTMAEPNLDTLLQYNRYGNNNHPMDYHLAVAPNTVYELQLLIWENYFTGTVGQRTMNFFIDGTTTLNSAASVTDLETIDDLAGPVTDTGFLFKYKFQTPATGPYSTSIDIHFTATVTGSASPSSPILNALILTVPEPASLSLLAIGAAGLLRRKQSRIS